MKVPFSNIKTIGDAECAVITYRDGDTVAELYFKEEQDQITHSTSYNIGVKFVRVFNDGFGDYELANVASNYATSSIDAAFRRMRDGEEGIESLLDAEDSEHPGSRGDVRRCIDYFDIELKRLYARKDDKVIPLAAKTR